MKEHILQVSGMSCGHCVRAVRAALETLSDLTVRDVTVGRARVTCTSEQLANAARVIAEAGFKVTLPYV